jgi:hypothetical protein
MPDDKEPRYGRQEMIAEYTQAATYHNSQVGIRFTIAGFYVAATGFLLQSALPASWQARAVVSSLGFLISGCLWIMDLRTRSLYTALAQRCIEIERSLWGLDKDRWYEGTFSRLFKTPPPSSRVHQAEVPAPPDRDWPDALELRWIPHSYRKTLSLVVSHSVPLSLLYLSGFFFWSAIFITAACKTWSR